MPNDPLVSVFVGISEFRNSRHREPEVLEGKIPTHIKAYREDVSAPAVKLNKPFEIQKGVAYASVFLDARSALANL